MIPDKSLQGIGIVLDRATLVHLQAWAARYFCDEEEQEKGMTRILRYLYSMDEDDKYDGIARGWPRVYDEATS